MVDPTGEIGEFTSVDKKNKPIADAVNKVLKNDNTTVKTTIEKQTITITRKEEDINITSTGKVKGVKVTTSISGKLKDVEGKQEIQLTDANIKVKGLSVKGDPGVVSLKVGRDGRVKFSTEKTVKVKLLFVTVQTFKAGKSVNVLKK